MELLIGGSGVRGLASPHPFLGATWGVVRALLSLWFHDVGRDCARLSVVLVLVFTALRVGDRMLLMGKVCACLLVVLVLCAHWCTDTAHGQGLRLFLRGSGTQRECVHWCTDTA